MLENYKRIKISIETFLNNIVKNIIGIRNGSISVGNAINLNGKKDTDFANKSHTHDGVYANKSHTHDGVYANSEHTHENYANKSHTHDGVYANSEHTHENYADKSHTHDGVYANSEHTHENYANKSHTHDGVYANSEHTHDSYADKSHTHDGVYANSEHTHDSYANISHTHNYSLFATTQSYVDVTSNRVINTKYYNTTDKPIFVSIVLSIGLNGYGYVFVSDIKIAHLIANEHGYSAPLSLILMPNHYYEITGVLQILNLLEFK